MSKQDLKEFKAFVGNIVRKYRYTMYITEYQIDILWILDEKKPTASEDWDIAASIDISPIYQTAQIKIYKTLWDRWQDKEYDTVENAVVHELCHILTESLYYTAINRFSTSDDVHNEREYLTERIAKIIIGMTDQTTLSVEKEYVDAAKRQKKVGKVKK